MNLYKHFIYSLLLLTLVTGCTQESPTTDENTALNVQEQPQDSNFKVSGVATKGPIQNATVEIFTLDINGLQTGALIASTTTDSSGQWQVSFSSAPTQSSLIKVSGGSYIDEADPAPVKRTIELDPTEFLTGVLFPGFTTASVTILTNALLEKSKSETTANNFFDVLNNNRNTAKLALGFDPFTTTAADPLSPSTSASIDSIEYAMYLGGVATALNSAAIILGKPVPDYDIMMGMVDDLSDGSLNGKKQATTVQIDLDGDDIKETNFPGNIDINLAIQRFRNNNFAAYSVTQVQGIVAVNEDVLSVPGTNVPPTAVDDSATTVSGVAINLANILVNDTDADGDALVIRSVTQPVDGSATLTGNNVTFIPSSGFVGNSVFSYTISDNRGGEDTAQVVISVTAAPVVGPPPTSGTAPTADAGADQTVDEQTLVTLTGSAADADGSIANVQWNLVTSGMTVALSGAGTDTATFTAPTVTQVTVLSFNFTVTDNEGLTATDIVSVVVSPVNSAPTADAGADQTVDEQTSVSLIGTASDTDGSVASVQWNLITTGTAVILSGASTNSATFTAPTVTQVTVLTFSFTVTDNEGLIVTDTIGVVVSPVNSAPTADAGAGQNVDEQTLITLTGSAADADGSIASVQWNLVTSGTTVALSGASTDTATFTAPTVTQVTVLTFTFTVTDNEGLIATDTISVVVLPVNVVPTADAGADQNTAELVLVTLTGTGADTDGSIASVQWNQVTGTPVILSGADTSTATFTTPSVPSTEALVFTLTVTDDEGAIALDSVNVIVNSSVNALPTTDAGVDQSVDELTSVTLSGSAIDTDGTIASTQWSQVSGTPVTITNVNALTATFTSPLVAINTLDVLVFQLQATDDSGGPGLDFVTVITNPVLVAPVANAGIDQTLDEGILVTVTLDGSASNDGTDGSITGHAWTQIAGTPTVTLSDASIASPTFPSPNIINNTTYTFQLEVTDNEGGTATDLVNINLVSLNSGPNVVDDIALADEDVSLVITGLLDNDTDPEGDTPLAINSVTQPANGSVVIDTGNTSVTYTPNLNFNGTDTFTYTANDSFGTISTTAAVVTVTINPVNDDPVAINDSGSVEQGFPLILSNLTVNDTDLEGDTLSITGVTQPANGVAVNNVDGTVTYTPDLTFNGADSFTYSIVDGNGGSATGTINVTVIADTDGDGVIDTVEVTDSTDPTLADSDGDGFFDGHEKIVGTNPNLISDVPSTTIISTANTNNVISVDTTWALAQSPFWLQSDVSIQNGTTLTIDPGVVVKSNAGIDIFVNLGGELNAQGNAATPQHVVFTSALDDSINGDTNGNSNANQPSDNDWGGIDFQSGSINGLLRHAAVKYGATCVDISNSSPVIDNVEIGDCGSYGILMAISSSTHTANLSSISFNDYDGNLVSTLNSSVRISSSFGATTALNIDYLNIFETGTSTFNDYGLEILANGGIINGTVSNISVVNPASDGINILNSSSGAVNIDLSNLSVTGSRANSLDVRQTSSGVLTTTFDGVINFTDNITTATAIYFENNNPDFLATSSTSVDAAGYGLQLNNSAGSFRNFTLNNIAIAGMRLQNASAPAVFSPIILTNAPTPYELVGQDLTPIITAGGYDFSDLSVAKDFIRILGTFPANMTLTSDPLVTGSSVWRVADNITIPVNVTLTVNDGAVLKFDLNKLLSVTGSLIVGDGNGLGTKSIFTSLRDDDPAAGGDSNSDGSATTPARTDWNYIQINNGSNIDIDNTIIRYADRAVLQSFSAPASFSISNSTITEFERRALEFTTTGDITYNLTNVSITNGGFFDGIFITTSGARAITLAFDSVNINNIGDTTDDHGIEILIDESSSLTGRLDNITVNNSAGTGIRVENATGGLVNPAFSGLNITNPGLYGLQLIGQSDGQTSPTVDGGLDLLNPVTNLIGDPLVAGSGGQFGLLVQGVNGVYNNIAISSVTTSAILTSGVNDPAIWDDATIILNNSPSPWYIRTQLAASIGVLGDPLNLGYTAGTGLTQSYITISSTIDDTTLVADPLGTGSSVWHTISNITIPAGVTLSVNDGAVLKFELNNLLTVSDGGTLIVGDGDGLGTKSIFTSIRDDDVTAGGDSNGDGTATAPARTDWNYIQLNTGSNLDIDNAIIRWADRGVLQNFTAPASFSISNSTITEFERYGLDLIAAGNITYNLTNVSITNGGFEDGIRVTTSGLRAITLAFDTLNIDTVGTGTTDHGIELFIDEGSSLTGRLDNITVNNTAGTGILLQNTTGGLANPVFSGLNITNPGLYGLQLIGQSDGQTQPTVDGGLDPLNPVTNLIGIDADPVSVPAAAGSGGQFGLLVQGVDGVYDNITISNVTTSALLMSGINNPTSWDDASILLKYSPSPWYIRTEMPASVGILNNPLDLGYSAGTGLIENHITISSSIDNMTMVADPLGTGSSVWHTIADITVPAGVTLTVDDGAILKFEINNQLSVNGTLIVGDGNGLGTKSIFTSIRDDDVTAGGDSNGDGTATAPARTDWNYIQLNTGSNLDIDNAIIRWADRGVLQNFTAPASFSISNSTITEFERYGMDLTTAGNITYNLTNVSIINGGFEDGIRITTSGLRAITLAFDTVNIDTVGNTTNDHGIELFIDEGSSLNGRLDNITVNNTTGNGILLQNTTGGLVDPVFSGLNITNPGGTRYGLQLIGNSDGQTRPQVTGIAADNVTVVTNFIGDALVAGSGGVYGMLVQGVIGSYSNITINSTTSSALYFSGDSAPSVWDSASIILDNSPSPYTLIGMNLPALVGYTIGPDALLVEDYARFTGTLTGNMTLAANPVGAGSHWRVPISGSTDLTVPSGVTLTIDPGAILKFETSADLTVQSGATLNVNGTAGNHVVMTSSTDNNVGVGNTALLIDWEGIVFQAGSAGGTINFLDVWYARDGLDFLNVTSNPTFNNLSVNYCQDALYINSTASMVLTFNNLSLSENTQQNIRLLGNGSMSTTFSETTPNGLIITDIPGNGSDAFNGILTTNTDASNTISGFTIIGPDDGIQVDASGATTIENNIIRKTGTFGINNTSSGSPIIRNNIIVSNFGAGINVTGNGNIIGNLIRQNTRSSGAGILVNDSSVTIENNLIIENHSTNNTTSGGGSGIYVATGTSSPTIINNTIANNTSLDTGNFEGAGVHVESTGGTITLRDNIIYGNTDSSGTPDNDIFDDAGAGSISGSNNLIGTIQATGNQYVADTPLLVGSDPLFVQGWFLSAPDIQGPISPAINAGSTDSSLITPVPLNTRSTRTDGAGDAGIVDLGYHFATAFVSANAGNTTVTTSPAALVSIADGTPVTITITPMDGSVTPVVIGAGLIVEAELASNVGFPSTGTLTTTGTNSTMSTVDDLGDGSYEVTFTPDTGFSGSEIISFTVNGVTITATVSVSWTI